MFFQAFFKIIAHGMNVGKPFEKLRQLQLKMQITFAVCVEISKQTAKQLMQSTLCSFKANCKSYFAVSIQTTKLLCTLMKTTKGRFETAKGAFQFALKFQSKLQS